MKVCDGGRSLGDGLSYPEYAGVLHAVKPNHISLSDESLLFQAFVISPMFVDGRGFILHRLQLAA